ALYGYLHDDLSRKRPTVNLVLDLLCPPGPERLLKYGYFADDAPLFQNHLLELEGQEQTLNQTVVPSAGLIAWLLGRYQTEAETRPFLHYEPEPRPQNDLLTQAQLAQVAYAAQTTAVVVLRGRDALCQQLAAQQLAYQQNRPLLTLDLAEALRLEKTAADVVRIALRDAQLTNAIPFLNGWDVLLMGDAPPPNLITLLCDFPDAVIVAGEEEWRPREIARQRRFLWFEFPVPDYNQRLHLLRFFISALHPHRHAPTPDEESLDLVGLATQFSLTTGQIRDLVHTAQDLAAGQQKPLGRQELFTAARAHSNPRLSTLASKITPRHDWADIILPPDQVQMLRELLNTVRRRPFVLEEWGLGKKLTASAGVTVLFAGPPGTGKTMAAEVLASEMGQDLYKINLSSVVSKYIGETEKNLEKIFLEAESSNAILFFDEADAIFGKRSEVKDAHDRYANVEVSYLLQRMERYDGVTILATNLRANLDEAFMRRLQFAIDFPFPEA
ncbi:MAG: ATP-binding protein, partial [Anaerolineales bacterium]|nr:ATP-binding protein [Anaerolineales bacterium]